MPEEKPEKLGYLEREEVRTMQKDIKGLREEEVKREREKIAALKTEEEARIEREKVERIKREAKERKRLEEKGAEIEERKIVEEIRRKARESLKKIKEKKRPIPRRPSFFEKIFIRLAIFVIIFLILANFFLYWYWYLKKPLPLWLPQFLRLPQIEEVTPPVELPPPPEEVPEEVPPEVVIPLSLIPVQATTTLKIPTPEVLPTSLAEVFKKEFAEGKLTRILIKDLKENKILGLKEFFQAFEIETPEGFFEKLSNDFTLFIYSTEERNSLGFITKIIEKAGLEDLLKSWEKTMEKDFKNLSIALGREKPARYPDFKEGTYKKITLRYLTITPEPDYFGICYGFFKDFFIYSSSCHNTVKLIDILTK